MRRRCQYVQPTTELEKNVRLSQSVTVTCNQKNSLWKSVPATEDETKCEVSRPNELYYTDETSETEIRDGFSSLIIRVTQIYHNSELLLLLLTLHEHRELTNPTRFEFDAIHSDYDNHVKLKRNLPRYIVWNNHFSFFFPSGTQPPDPKAYEEWGRKRIFIFRCHIGVYLAFISLFQLYNLKHLLKVNCYDEKREWTGENSMRCHDMP